MLRNSSMSQTPGGAPSRWCFDTRDQGYGPPLAVIPLGVNTDDDIRIARFDPAMQDAFRPPVLDAMAESWGLIDESLNTDLDHIDAHYGNHCVARCLRRRSCCRHRHPPSSGGEGDRSDVSPSGPTWHCDTTLGGVGSSCVRVRSSSQRGETNARWRGFKTST